jgi:hypothetical protein
MPKPHMIAISSAARERPAASASEADAPASASSTVTELKIVATAATTTAPPIPDHRSGEHLSKRLRGLEPVTRRDGYPPGRDLDRVELIEAVVAKGLDTASEQEAQLLERHGRGFVLFQVLLNERGQGERSRDAALASERLERSPERRPSVLLARKPAPLHPPRTATTDPIPVRPQRLLASTTPQPEHLTLLKHVDHSLRTH